MRSAQDNAGIVLERDTDIEHHQSTLNEPERSPMMENRDLLNLGLKMIDSDATIGERAWTMRWNVRVERGVLEESTIVLY